MKKKAYNFVPEFRPRNIQVILDEGVEQMTGVYICLPILKVEYDTDIMRITVKDYREAKEIKP